MISRRSASRLWLLPCAALLLATGLAEAQNSRNAIPPRLQWEANGGYCGEVSLISAGLYYGQYLSQFDARVCAIGSTPQSQGELLLGDNDQRAAARMHLRCEEWNGPNTRGSRAFLRWVKHHVVQGHPVAIGVFNNEYQLYGSTDPSAGDPQYDHIVPVFGIRSHHPILDGKYFADDRLTFSDNGLWGRPFHYPYFYTYRFAGFPRDRARANAREGPLYSLPRPGRNYGIAILGVKDADGDTLPVRMKTSVNHELPAMRDGSNVRPAPMPLTLTVTVSGLTPGVDYRLYRYDDLAAVPDSRFNAHAANARTVWKIRLSAGTTYTLTQRIQSDQTVVYRAVRASAP
jgi:hypothetical protein